MLQKSLRICPSLSVILPLMLCVGNVLLQEANAFPLPKNMPEGWHAKITFGAQATAGASRNDSLHGSVDASYRSARWENRLQAKLHRSNVSFSETRIDDNGDVELNDAGEPVLFIARRRSNNRRKLSVEPRFFIKERVYTFGLLDVERNIPANIYISSRQVAGLGYRWWESKANFLSMGFGVGRKQSEKIGEEQQADAIGYIGLRIVRKLTERTSVDFGIDTDFGSDNRLTEVALGFSWKVNDPISLKLGFESRMNSETNDPDSPFDESVDAEFTASIVYDVL